MTEARATDFPDDESIELASAPIEVEAGEAPAANTPGYILRRAREARGQSIADVVQVIRFSARQIEALERDDYASLPGSTAVRGMVRNYAKYLKLDASPLLAQLDPAVPVPEADVRAPTNMGDAKQPTMVERVPSRFIVAGVAALLLLLAGYGYFNFPGVEGVSDRLSGSDRGALVTKRNAMAEPAVLPVLVPTPAVIAESVPADSNVAAGAPQSGGLRVEFDDRAWIEIRDAAQKVVFVGEYPAGTRQNVEGKPPFQIWIGKASGVRLFMGERSIDLKPHTREEVARFSLE